MAATSRSALIARTMKVLKKRYTPVPAPKDRSLLDHLLFGCLLENSPYEDAERVFATLQKDYFGWNEVRVSTVRELAEVTKPLPDAAEAAARLKKTLHSVFEAIYQFDLETLKKQNIGVAVKQLQKYIGTTPFVVSYVTQMALGGHSIPINHGLLTALQVVGVITESEAQKGLVPGLERAIPKNKGVEYGSLLHQLGVEVGRNPYGPTARKLLLEIAPDCKDRLPKRLTKRAMEEEAAAAAAAAAEAAQKAAAAAERKSKKEAKATAKAPAGKQTVKPSKKDKKATKRPVPPTKTAVGKKKKTTSQKLTKRKPR